ncbi:uncharacterized protein N7459_006046 [Penicillium hispanicum]|uniref:uncharacterized protein n=1 Tax=Penicillium hispanicum TaxID=1080232 RepID=UPI00253FC0F0|nr:uncharacterized protein N7459_006046 [Penicillium hispanicum]KAJ5580061.1 hypothetical protein N7459_006046 [Penicillium hispanicum]
MRSYKTCQDRTGSGGSSSSTDTNDSDRSKSTAPTVASDRTASASKHTEWSDIKDDDGGPRDSTSTYASTTGSTSKLAPEGPQYEVDDRQEAFPTDALASTPSSFAGLFPSSRRLLIRHDDATLDGNMNLRVDTVVPCRGGYQQDVILFHLRMYDLFSRKFSLRRYCRDSGREVCHCSRKEASPGPMHPAFRRSWSSVLASLRPGSSGHASSPPEEWKRLESGKHEEVGSTTEEAVEKGPALADTILLEFSNYAHVELRRRGPGAAKRYEYEYWSTKYQWRREFRKEGDLREVSYYLVDTRTSQTIAHLVPEIMAPLEVVEEESKGGWVPPCSLWIRDPSVYERMPDVADAIVATGLVALVDDCIRRRWHHERRGSWMLPAGSSFTKSLERMGPRRLIGEVLHRRGSA